MHSSLLAITAGFCLGFVYFGGLYMTLRALPSTRHPVLVATLSYVLRTLIVTVVLIVAVINSSFSHIVLITAGLVVARSLLVRRWRPYSKPSGQRSNIGVKMAKMTVKTSF
jgi:F1F0 ATPase subunit 2